jgi:hypothetical protein
VAADVQEQSENPEGNAMSFDNIFYSILQVVIIASSMLFFHLWSSTDNPVNSWSDGMYNSMDSDYFGSCIYFVVGVIVINLWMINLVVAVVVNTFKDIRASTKRSAFGAERYQLSATVLFQADRQTRGQD